MARAFDITAVSDKVRLDTKGRGSATFKAANVSGRRLRGRATVVAKDPSAASWLAIADNAEQDFDAGARQEFTVSVTVPADARGGTHAFRLDLVSVDNPDEETAQGPFVTVTVAAAPPPPPKSHLLWIVLAVVVVLIMGGAAIWLLTRRPAPGDFAGSWSTNFGTLQLKQDGEQVSGEYQLHGSSQSVKFQGAVYGTTLSGVIGDPAAKTTFTMTLDPVARAFKGTWGSGKPWCGVADANVSLPDDCSFSGQWTLMFDGQPRVATLRQSGGIVSGTIDLGAPDHRKVELMGEMKGWAVEGELKGLAPIRWTAVDQKFAQFQGIRYEPASAGSPLTPGVTFQDTCGFRQGSSAPVPCREPAGIVISRFSLDAPPGSDTSAEQENGPVRAFRVDGDFRVTLVVDAVTAGQGQLVGLGVRKPDRPKVWMRIGKSFMNLEDRRSYAVLHQRLEDIDDVDILDAKIYTGDRVHFKIQRRGKKFAFFFSPDGTTWTSILGDEGVDFEVDGAIELFATAVGSPAGGVHAELADLAITKP